MEPSVDIDTRGSCSIRKLASRNSGTNLVAAPERDVVLARLGDSLNRHLRPNRDTVVSAHRKTLRITSYVILSPEIARANNYKHAVNLDFTMVKEWV
jgi:hypothetical protein